MKHTTKLTFEVVATLGSFVVHRSFQVAKSREEAIEQVKTYHMTPGTQYDSVRATQLSMIDEAEEG